MQIKTVDYVVCHVVGASWFVGSCRWESQSRGLEVWSAGAPCQSIPRG